MKKKYQVSERTESKNQSIQAGDLGDHQSPRGQEQPKCKQADIRITYSGKFPNSLGPTTISVDPERQRLRCSGFHRLLGLSCAVDTRREILLACRRAMWG